MVEPGGIEPPTSDRSFNGSASRDDQAGERGAGIFGLDHRRGPTGIDPADRRTGNEWARFESGRRNPTNERPACSEPLNSRLGAAPDQRLA